MSEGATHGITDMATEQLNPLAKLCDTPGMKVHGVSNGNNATLV